MRFHTHPSKIHAYFASILFLLFSQILAAQPNNGYIQDVVMPAPNAASLVKFSEVPVSLYTGVPSINIPITTVTDGALSLPLSLGYHASGVKVAENASWVGTGWALQAGGMITRTILSFPDENLDKGYFYKGKYLVGDAGEFTQISGCYAGTLCLDTEPDVFHFSLPGYSGKFFFDKDNVPQFIPRQDIKLIRNGVFEQFILITPDGNKYYFGKHPITNTLVEERTQTPAEPAFGNPTSWYLVRIESFNATNYIDLNYVDENYSYTELAACSFHATECAAPYGNTWTIGESCQTTLGVNGQAAHTINVKGKRLSQITTPTQTVTFFANTIREDLNLNVSFTSSRAKQLDSIHVATGTLCKSFVLNYDYFHDLSTPNVETLAESKRLKLLSVTERSCDGTIAVPPHVFTYEGETITKTVGGTSITRQFLPWRLSKQQDHWGFYNGPNNNDNNYVNVPLSSITIPGTQTVVNYGSSLRESVEAAMLKGSLKQIDYPNGGNTKFVLEANDYPVTVETSSPLSPPLVVQTYTNPDPDYCCGQKTVTGTYTFSTAPGANIRYKLTLTEPFDGGCSGQYDMTVKISALYNNQQLGTYNFNLSSGTYATPLIPLSNLIGTNPPLNVPITFELITLDGWGKFEVFNITSTYVNKKAGGLRVKEVRTNDGVSTANDIVRTYTYRKFNDQTRSSGSLTYPPKYAFAGAGFYETGQQMQTYYSFNSSTFAPLGGFEGVALSYEEVRESTNGNGYKDYTFTTEYPSTYYSYNEFPFPSPPFYNANGKVQLQKTYSQNNVLVQSTSNIMDNSAVNYITPPGVMYKTHIYHGACPPAPECPECTPHNILLTKTYEHRTAIRYRLKETTTVADGVSVKTNYAYDPLNKHTFPVKSEYFDSEGKKITTKFSYPTTLAFQCLRDDLTGRNMIISPTSTKNYVNDLLVSGDSTRWSNWAGGFPGAACGGGTYLPYPWEFYRYEMTYDASGNATTGAWVKKGTMNERYNTAGYAGLPKKFTQTNWAPEAYEWTSGGRITKRTFNSEDPTTYKQFATQYEYLGNSNLLTKLTDIDGQFTEYTYDKLMRLESTKARKVGTTPNVQSFYTYKFKNATTPRSYVRDSTVFTDMTANGSAFKERVVSQYFDGLGRLVQTVDKKHSPASKDVVVTNQYDNQGCTSKVYEPFESTLSTGAFMATVPSGTPFTLTEYYSDPLNRPWKVTPPSWYPTIYSYGANAANSVVLGHGTTPTYFAANSLYMATVEDPNGNKSISFMDKKGRTILSRKSNGTGTTFANTYYLYDNKDRLVKVLPPGVGVGVADTNLIFNYRYDAADNMVFKNVPDAAPLNLKYNNRDLLTLLQDGNLLNAPLNWIATNYDVYGRPTSTGFVINTASPDPNSTFTFTDPNKLTETTYDDLTSYQAIYKGRVRQSRVKILDTNNSFITTDFTYDVHGRMTASNANNHMGGSDSYKLTYDWADNLLTSTRTHNRQSTDPFISILETTTYDHAGRVKLNKHKLGANAEVTLSQLNYNYKDELIEKNLGYASATSTLQSLDFSYNPQGWLTAINQPVLVPPGLPTGPVIALTSCPTAAPGLPAPGTGSTPDANDLFYLELKYDNLFSGINGTQQMNGNIAQMMWRTRGRERQAYNFSYDFLNRLFAANYYDVNEAGTASATVRYNEAITYNDLRGNIGTLTRNGGVLTGPCWNFAQIDNLSYTYTTGTNRLASITDAASATYKAKGFNPGIGTGTYQYDLNGNMKNDPYKGLAITYNHLNLPKNFNFGAGKVIDITYDATGRLLKKTIAGGTANYVQDYFGGIMGASIEYRDGLRESIPTAEGRLFYTSPTSTRYEYAITDHLGNTRLTFTDKNSNGAVDFSTEVLQENHYYPFGLGYEGPWVNDAALDNRYQYNGKEWNDDFGLNWNNYGARWYDGSMGRWRSVDPLSEPTGNHSPYHYAYNNPVSYVDLFGMIPKGGGNGGVQSALVDDDLSGLGTGDKMNLVNNGFFNLGSLPPIRWKKTVDESGNETYEYVNDDGGDETDYVDNYDCNGAFCHTDELSVVKTVSNDVKDVTVAPGLRVGYATTPSEFYAIAILFGGSWITTTIEFSRSKGNFNSNSIPKIIDEGKQGKHIRGHNNFQEGRSTLTENAQELLNAVHAGNVKSIQSINGVKTRVDFGKVIGNYVKDGISIPTTRGIIHNSKRGAHIVPSAPK